MFVTYGGQQKDVEFLLPFFLGIFVKCEAFLLVSEEGYCGAGR